MRNPASKLTSIPLLMLVLFIAIVPAQAQWVRAYQNGLQAMKNKSWQTAAGHFHKALETRDKDKDKVRAKGTIFIQYYPNRELGICYYHMSDMVKARIYLERSLEQAASIRARRYLNLLNKSVQGETVAADPKVETPEDPPSEAEDEEEKQPPAATLVGERLSIAVLPIESKGLGEDLGSIDILDKLITGLVSLDRFKVIERAQLEQILNEQQLGMTGMLDAATAAQIGKGIGVDAVLVGSVTQSRSSASIDARLIDTETTEILTARDAYSSQISLQSISEMVGELAGKIKTDFPIVHGVVIGINGEELTLDMGRSQGISKGMKCHIYREGAPIVHPVSGEVIGKMIDEICDVRITDVFDSYSLAVIVQIKDGSPAIRDNVITK